MNVREILEFLDKVTDAASEVSGGLPIPILDSVVKIADTAVEIAENILDRVEDGRLVLGEADQEKLDAAIARLSAINDELNAQIVAS